MKNGSVGLMLAGALMLCAACTADFDPETALRIEYVTPLGCDEVSGVALLQAAVLGDKAPVPAAMRYELRTHKDGDPAIVYGYAPDFAANFDTNALRDGLIFYTAVPVNGCGTDINITSPVHGARYSPPVFRGLMVNNGNLDLSKPLVVFGAESEPYSGDPGEVWTAEQLAPHMSFAATLMDQLKSVGYIPALCFGDRTTIIIDPSDPLAEEFLDSDNLVDMMGEPVNGNPRWNRGTACMPAPFFEFRQPNGIPDIWENTALDNVRAYARYGFVKNEPEAFGLYAGIAERLLPVHGATFEHQSYFAFKAPVRYAEPENLLKKKLKSAVLAGATCVLVYDFYVKTNDFEMSVGSWPQYQLAIDEINAELGTQVHIGAVSTHASQLMHYDALLRSVFLGIRHTIRSAQIAPGKKVGIVLVEHGIGRAGRLYDVTRISTPLFNERLHAWLAGRLEGLYASDVALSSSYIAGTCPPADGVTALDSQVADWVAQGFDCIVVYPVDWFWESRQTYFDLRQEAVKQIDRYSAAIFERDDRDRTDIMFDATRIVISETTLSKKISCPAAYHYLKAAGAQHLEDRLIAMSGAFEPAALAGTLTITGGIDLQCAFVDRALIHDNTLIVQQAGLRAHAAISATGAVGAFDADEMGYFLFALLAEHAVDVDRVIVSEAAFELAVVDGAGSGWIQAQAVAYIQGAPVPFSTLITF